MDDLVSVITPSFNTSEYIGKTIESVQNQTYQNWELIIVDDCSSDATDFIVEPYLNDHRIKYLKNEKNLGAALSRNRALREAKGKWIAFLDSDDLWSQEKLERQILFMKENNYFFSYTEYEEIDENGIALGVKVSGPKHISNAGMNAYCWPGCLTVMFDAEKIGLIQIKDIKKNNDYAVWLKVCKMSKCHLLKEVLAKYRKRSNSISRHGIKTMIGWHYKLWREIEGKNIILSLMYTGLNIMIGTLKKINYVKRIETK